MTNKLTGRAALLICLFLFAAGAARAAEADAVTGATGSPKDDGKSSLKEFASFLAENPVGVMATLEKGRPRTRVFMMLWVEGNRVYFSTGDSKAVAAQIKTNPNVSFCTRDRENSKSVSVSGKAAFTTDLELKKWAIAEHGDLKAIYKTPDNPDFSIFYIDPDEIIPFSIH